MGRIDVHTGAFAGKEVTFVPIKGFTVGYENIGPSPEKIAADQIKELTVINEEDVQHMAASLGMGTAGLLLLGPIGAAAGVLTGGKKKKVTFTCTLKDERKFLGTTDNKTYTDLISADMAYNELGQDLNEDLARLRQIEKKQKEINRESLFITIGVVVALCLLVMTCYGLGAN